MKVPVGVEVGVYQVPVGVDVEVFVMVQVDVLTGDPVRVGVGVFAGWLGAALNE